MRKISISDVQEKVSEAAFGKPLITNVLRGQVVEAIIALALEPQWRWCAEDYSSWDFERKDGLRLEVKQSAARQTWAASEKPSPASFDIATRTGRWDGADWLPEPGRAADIYIFAHHPISDSTADHRDPAQWDFYVVRSTELPETRRLSLLAARRLSGSHRFFELLQAVESESRLCKLRQPRSA